MTDQTAEKLARQGVDLPAAAAPAGAYVAAVRTGDLLFVSGQIPVGPKGIEFVGRCGAEFGIDEGHAAARLCAINILAQVKAAIGSLDKVKRCVRLGGFVNSTDDFGDHPKVINGASELMADAFGDKGKHTRAAVGVANLPFGVAVEVDAIFEVE